MKLTLDRGGIYPVVTAYQAKGEQRALAFVQHSRDPDLVWMGGEQGCSLLRFV